MAKRAKPAAPRTKLMNAAFKAAIRDGWSGLKIADVAKSAGLMVADAYRIAPDRPSLMDAYAQGIDARVAEQLAAEPGDSESWRDAAFDGFMMRFDAMLKDRDALRVIFFDDSRDLIALARGARRARRSIERILEAADFAKDSLALTAGAIALLPLYARVYRIWLNDEVDQAKTMAALDKALLRLDRLKERIAGRTRPSAPPEQDSVGDEAAHGSRAAGRTTH